MKVKNHVIKVLSFISFFLFSGINTTGCKEEINGEFAYFYEIDSSSPIITEKFKLFYSNTIQETIVNEGGMLLNLSGIAAKFTGEQKECNQKAIAVVKKSLDKIETKEGTGSVYNENSLCIRIILPTSSPDENGEILYEQKMK